MISRCLLSVSLALVFLAEPFAVKADDYQMRREMDRAYSAWRSALAEKNLAGWQQATASYRQMLTRNLIISQRQPFPAALFDLPIRPPETTGLRFIKVKQVGDTANLYYYGKVDVGLTDPSEVPESLLILKFIREGSAWKFDTTRMVSLGGAPEVKSAMQNGGGGNFLESPELAPDGVVPPTPKAAAMLDRIGVLQVASFGFETKATVNGFDVPSVTNNAEEHIIIGGLRDGQNPLTVSVKPLPIPEGEKRVLEVNALVLTGSEQKPYYKVFTYKPAPESVQPTQQQIIHVSRITMRD